MKKINNIFIKKKIILGIETSFNDTCSSIIKGNKILSNIIYTQNHNKYKGVKPNLAFNLHLKKIYNIVKESIIKSNIKINKINAISYTRGPGLIGSLMIGENFSKSLSLSLNIPLIAVNHIHAHLFSIFIYNKNKKYPNIPYICLSISGGHTKIFIVKGYFNIIEIGKTLDENLGRVYDKVSILLGYDYLNGPKYIEKMSENGEFKYILPIPKVSKYDFSFSGLLTYIKNIIIKGNININNLCRSFQETIYIILKNKIKKVLHEFKIKDLVITGGVACNLFLKKKFKLNSKKNKYNLYINYNNLYLKDNAAMIALIGQIKYFFKKFDTYDIESKSKLNIKEL